MISAVVLSYRHPRALARGLEALRTQTRPPGEILVVDNGTPAEDLAGVRGRFSDAVWIVPGGNLGYSGGMNAGLARARCDLVLLQCDDAVPDPGYLEALAAPFSDPSVAFACGVQRENGRTVYAGGSAILDPWPRLDVWTEPRGGVPYETGYATGASVLCRRSTLDALGRLDTGFFMYWEDVDLSLHALRRGFRILCVPAARFETLPGRDLPEPDLAAVARAKRKGLLRLRLRHGSLLGLPTFLARYLLWRDTP